MSNLVTTCHYELTTYRDGENLGSFQFSTAFNTTYTDVLAYCNKFLLGVDYDLAELCRLHPAILNRDEIIESFTANLLETWPPLR